MKERVCRVETRTRFEQVAETVLNEIDATQDMAGYGSRRRTAIEGLLVTARKIAADETHESA